jgi:hypothetical protein
MSDDRAVWDQRGTLTRSYDEKDGSALPPLPDERQAPAPLRDILGDFVAATPRRAGTLQPRPRQRAGFFG